MADKDVRRWKRNILYHLSLISDHTLCTIGTDMTVTNTHPISLLKSGMFRAKRWDKHLFKTRPSSILECQDVRLSEGGMLEQYHINTFNYRVNHHYKNTGLHKTEKNNDQCLYWYGWLVKWVIELEWDNGYVDVPRLCRNLWCSMSLVALTACCDYP